MTIINPIFFYNPFRHQQTKHSEHYWQEIQQMSHPSTVDFSKFIANQNIANENYNSLKNMCIAGPSPANMIYACGRFTQNNLLYETNWLLY